MKKTIMLAIAIVLMFFQVHARGESGVGIIKTMTGDVIIKRAETNLPAKAGDHLIHSDTVITQPESTAGIIFTDGTTFTVGPESEFELNRYVFEPGLNQYDFSIYLKQGTIIYNSGKIGKLAPEAVNLSTPRASVGIRGTRFIMKTE